MKHLIVSLHDFHPGSLEAVREQIDLLGGLGVDRFSILAIPHYHHGKRLKDFSAAKNFLHQRRAAGDEVVIHGFFHDRAGAPAGSWFWTRFYTANEAEFLDLSDGEVEHRIGTAVELWQSQGWPTEGFIAPAWILPPRQDAILRRMGFLYTTRLREIHVLQKKRHVPAQSLCYSTRSAWRRGASQIWNPALFWRLRRNQVLRLSLHPGDLTHPAIRQQILELTEMALAEGFQPVTYASYVQM